MLYSCFDGITFFIHITLQVETLRITFGMCSMHVGLPSLVSLYCLSLTKLKVLRDQQFENEVKPDPQVCNYFYMHFMYLYDMVTLSSLYCNKLTSFSDYISYLLFVRLYAFTHVFHTRLTLGCLCEY